MVATFERRIGINAVGDIFAFHRRSSGASDIRWHRRWSASSRRFRRTRTNHRIRWNVASFRIGIENQIGRTIQTSSLTTVTTEKFVRTFIRVVAVLTIATIEIDFRQSDRRRIRKWYFGAIRLLTGTSGYTIFTIALIGFVIVEKAVRTFERNRNAADTNVESITAKRFRFADRIRIIAIGFILTIDDWSGRRHRDVRRSFGR